jgi:hypothetical protein
MTSLAPPICVYCKRFRPEDEGFVCEAFPDGIPTDILENRADHRRPLEGDHGLRFAPDTRAGALWAVDVFGPLGANDT